MTRDFRFRGSAVRGIVMQMPGILLLLALWIQTPATPLRTGTVTGALRTSTGTPMEGVRVALTPADAAIADDLLESIGLTDKDGRYVLEGVLPGRYYIVIGRGPGSLYHPGVPEKTDATIISVTSAATLPVADVVSKRMRVTGRVVDWATGEGRRIANLRICCDLSPYGTASGGFTGVSLVANARSAFAATVRGDGTFVFDDIPSGKFTLQASDPGNIIAIGQPFSVGQSDVDGLVVRVSNGVAVQGSIVDRLGIPVPGVMARLTPRSTNTAFPIPDNVAVPAAGLETVLVLVSSNGIRPTLDVLQSALMRAVKPEFVPVDANGRLNIDRVVPGAYLLEVNAPGRGLAEREVEVGPRGITDLLVEVPVTRLVGRIVPAGTDPLPKLDGSIRLIPSAPGAQILYLFPETDGRFYPLLTPGEYRVSTDNLGQRVQSVTEGSKDLTIAPLVFDGVRKPEIVITLEP